MNTPKKPRGPVCTACNTGDSFCNGAVWKCSGCKRTLLTASPYEIQKQKDYDAWTRNRRTVEETDKILLGQLVSGHQLQAGIALAVAQGVWHWADSDSWKEHRIWTTQDIIEVLKDNTKIVIADLDGILSVKGIKVGTSAKKTVERGDYAQAVLLLGAQAIDVLRQLRAPDVSDVPEVKW